MWKAAKNNVKLLSKDMSTILVGRCLQRQAPLGRGCKAVRMGMIYAIFDNIPFIENFITKVGIL